jgi:hypothetical protein
MARDYTKPTLFVFVLIGGLLYSLSLVGVAATQGNTSLGTGALQNNTTGNFNTASGIQGPH